jgi:hypothetical protein
MDAERYTRRQLDEWRQLVTMMTDDNNLSAEELERQRRRRLINEARERVAKLRDIEKYREEIERLPAPEVARRLIPAAADDCVERWAADAAKRERERVEAEAELTTRSADDGLIYKRYENQPAEVTRAGDDWNEWFDARLDARLEQERKMIMDITGEALGELLAKERKKREDTIRKVREELRELKLECAKLASESAALREALAADRGKVVEMPSPLRRVN